MQPPSAGPSFEIAPPASTHDDRASVVANTLEVDGVRRLGVTPRRPWRFAAGQVAELSAGPGTEGYFAIATSPHEGPPLVFLIKAEGSDSKPLMLLAPGAEVTLRGPFGTGFSLPAATVARDLLFVTAGTAIAAARSAIGEALAEGGDTRVTLVVGVRRLADLCLRDELAAWRRRGVEVCVCVSGDDDLERSATPFTLARGRVQAHLGPHIRPTTRAFIAGSEELEDEVTDALVRLGAPPDRIQRNYRPDYRATHDGGAPPAAR